MAEIQELAEAYRQGALSRREFIRRVILVAGGMAAALPFLAPMGITEAEAATGGGPATEEATRRFGKSYTYKIYPNAQHEIGRASCRERV